MSYQTKTPMKDSSKNLFEYPTNISNQKNKLSDVTAQGAIGSLFARSNSKAPKQDLSALKVDPALYTITNEGSDPILDILRRRLSQGGRLPTLEQTTLPKAIVQRREQSMDTDLRIRTMKAKKPSLAIDSQCVTPKKKVDEELLNSDSDMSDSGSDQEDAEVLEQDEKMKQKEIEDIKAFAKANGFDIMVEDDDN